MAYKLTPYDRRVQAELIRQEREAKFASRYPTYKKTGAATVAPVQDEKKKNGFVTALHTVGDVAANVGIGAGKGIEGIVDLFAGIGGAVAGIFSDEAEDAVKNFVARDLTGELYGNDWQEGLDQSALNGAKAGEIIEGVAQGVGQMLPAVAVSLIPGVGQAATVGMIAGSAAGTGAESAFQDGADYGQGMAYGAASGVLEAGTELLTGGAGKVIKKGANTLLKSSAKSVGKEVAETGLKRAAKEAISEGAEEMISEVANPALKTIYKGKDALKEYSDEEFWGGVLEAGVIGAGTQMAYANTVGRVTRQSGVYADANSVAEHIEEQRKKIDTGELSPEAEVQAQKNIKRDMELLSGRLQRVSQKTRERILRSPEMSVNFDADGKIKAEIAEKLDANIKAAGDTSSGLDRRYYSASARGREAQIIEGLAAQGTKVFEGELTKEEGAAYQKAKEIHRKLKSAGFVDTDLVLSETMPDANAYLDGRTVVIGKDSLADGSYVKHLVHETTHFTEGTMEWLDVMDHVFGKDGSAVQHLIERVKASGYGVTDADVTAVLDAVREGKLKDIALTEKQNTLVTEVVAMQMEETFGSEDAINRLVGEKPNLAKRILSRIKAFLQTFGKSTDRDPETVKQLRRTEELFRKALEKAGVGYAAEELTRMNEKNAQVSEENGGQGVDEEQKSEYNEGVKYSQKINKYLSYSQIGNHNVETIKRQLSKLYSGIEGGVADNIAIEIDNTVYVVDTGNQNGEIRVGFLRKRTIKEDEKRRRYARGINQESYDRGFGNRTVFERIGVDLDHDTGSDVRRELRTNETVDQTKSRNIQNGASGKNGNQGVSVSKPQIKKSRKATPAGYSFAEVAGEALTNEELAELQRLREQKSHMDEVVKATRGRANDKVYTKKDAENVLSAVLREELSFKLEEAQGALYGAKRTEAIDRIWRALNTAKEGRRTGLALEIADYIIDSAIIDEMDPFVKEDAAEKYRFLQNYTRKLDLAGVDSHYTKKYGRFWKASKDLMESGEAISLKQAATELNNAGFQIDADGGASTLLDIQTAYEETRALIKNEYKTKLSFVVAGEREDLRQGIAKEILRGFDNTGSRSRDALERKHIDEERSKWRARMKKQLERARDYSIKQAEKHSERVSYWRGERNRVAERYKRLNSLKYELEKLANQKKGLYVNAANYRGDSFKVAIDELAKMNWRGGLVNDTKIREHFAKLAAWYTKENPLYKGDGGTGSLFRQEIADILNSLGNSQNGALTVEDLQAAETVVKYFAHEIEAHNTYYKDEKRLDATPKAKEYIEKVLRAKEIAAKCGIWSNLMRSKFARMVADPAMLMRQADGYLDGFFTEQYEALRQGTIDAAVLERELSKEFEKFWEEHKAYGKRYNDATVKFGDTEMPLQEAISLYMTMKREHAFAGLAGAGFEIDGKKATENISDGFAEEVNRQLAEDWKGLPPEELLTLTKKKNAEMEQAALRKVIEKKRKALYDQFTDEDKALISLMEKTFEQCRDVKVKIDEIVQGYSNVTNGYYYPIKRTGAAENVDAYTGFEGDRVSNLSMNKETVKNAHKLLIEPAHIVFMRHLKATSLYHGLGVFTDNFNRLYNLDITGPAGTEKAAQSAAAQLYAKAEANRDIIALIDKVKQGQHKANDFVDLGTVSAEVATKIKEVTGQDFTGYKIAVEARQIEHILKRHGENGAADHSMAKDEDIAKMMLAIFKPDYISDGGNTRAYVYSDNGKMRPAKTVICEKAIGEKSYYTIQTAVDTNKKTLHVVSAFIGESGYKRGASQTLDAANAPRGNAQSGNARTPTHSIPQNSDGVNTAGLENYRGGPKTVRDALGQSNKFAQEMIKYFKELKQDVEGISKKGSQERAYNDAVAFIRSSYATYQLGANPKVWVTQLSSYIAAHGLIDADCLVKGLAVSGKDVDEYCRLAWLRNNDGSAAQAQAVGTSQNAVQRAGRNVLQKIRDGSMWMIGRVDRLMITRLFGACQVQVEKKGGAKVGTKENKIAAGKLLQRVILETQQNSLATERSAAMRSSDELLKGFTMFSADAMKVGARFVDAFGELSVLRTLRREAKKAGNSKEIARLDTEIKRARKQCVRATVSLVGVALFNAALAYGFKWLYRRDEDESLGTFIADTFGNMLGGIPFVRDLWSFFQDGFEMDHFLISTVNDVLGTAAASFELVSDAASGKEVTRQEVLANMRKVVYAAGQLSGVPTRNLYNFTSGVVNRVSPEAGYALESQFFKQSFASDLKKALDAGDDKMVGTIAGLMIDEKIGIEDGATRKVLQTLTEKGHSVLPRSVGDSVTVNGETVALTGAQQKKLRAVYGIGQEAVADMVKLKQFQSAGDEVQAAAIKFVYDVYWDLALEDALGLDLAEKNVLFAEAIDIEKLAVIIAMARAIEADKDKDGKAIAGTKKRKLQTFVNSLRLSAAEKYMVMGYLGYANANGESQVKAHISKLNLSKSEKEKLLGYSGY